MEYAQARYYNANAGKFISIDPLVSNIASKQKLQSDFDTTQYFQLSNPQYLNSYSYSYNNPLTFVDPTGESGMPFPGLTYYSNKFSDIGRNVSNQIKGAVEAGKAAVGTCVGAAAIVFAPEAAAPAVIGGVINMATKAYGDFEDDASFNESKNSYAASGAFGAASGYALKDYGVMGTAIGAGISEGIGSSIMEGSYDPYSVAGASIGAGLTRGVMGGSQIKSFEPFLQQGFERLSQAAAEVVTTVKSTEIVKSVFGDKE